MGNIILDLKTVLDIVMAMQTGILNGGGSHAGEFRRDFEIITGVLGNLR